MYSFFAGRGFHSLRPVFYSIVAFFGLLLVLSTANAYAQAQKPLPTITLTLNDYSVLAEVADTPSTRSQGLMYRQALEPDNGMLFVFDTPLKACFWMKNTQIPLSIAFITANGTISNIEAMEPFSLASICPTQPILYALEMEQGWFDKRSIQAGDTVQKLP